MTLQEDRAELIAQARGALGISAVDIDDAARRFAARLEADEQRGGWRGSLEFVPVIRTWGRVLVLGAVGVALIAVTMVKCPLYEQAIAPPPVVESSG